MSDYLRLTRAPYISWSAPTCSACDVDLEFDDGWLCPSCGTAWGSMAGDGDYGELYESWAGEPAGGLEVTKDEAWQISHLQEPDRTRSLERIRDRARNPANYV